MALPGIKTLDDRNSGEVAAWIQKWLGAKGRGVIRQSADPGQAPLRLAFVTGPGRVGGMRRDLSRRLARQLGHDLLGELEMVQHDRQHL
jgi:hypothetical protein